MSVMVKMLGADNVMLAIRADAIVSVMKVERPPGPDEKSDDRHWVEINWVQGRLDRCSSLGCESSEAAMQSFNEIIAAIG